METSYIRNFCILAHIDHGKSTLADRFLELTGTIEKRKMRAQVLDMHPLEREKGITIKMQPVRMRYAPRDGNDAYELNLIDTPGHADFSYEVSRALAAVEGAILLVDATQGVQAQTIANLRMAMVEELVIIPVLNKIDLPSADVERTAEELGELLDVPRGNILSVSAKEGTGVRDLLDAVIARIPPPRADGLQKRENAPVPARVPGVNPDALPLRALIIDSKYDAYQGVIAHVRVFSGALKKGMRIRCMATGQVFEALEVGVFVPERSVEPSLHAGAIGYVATGVKEPQKIRVGDTLVTASTAHEDDRAVPLSGYRQPEPMVFASLFPENQDDFESLRAALEKLKLEDAALAFEPEESAALGRGFRAGFLGILHAEIITERLRREYAMALVLSNPSVAFRILTKNGAARTISSAAKMPPVHEVVSIEEPWAEAEIIAPARMFGAITHLINERGGSVTEAVPLAGERLQIRALAPLREIIVDFYDTLKGISQGLASLSYVLCDYRPGDLVRLDIRVAGEQVASFAEIVPRERAVYLGRARVEKLKDLIPRALFSIALQAETDGRIIARETIPAMRKDVTGYLYGGDRTRKMKLWKKQQRGKKRMKETATVTIPPEVFLKMLRK